MTRYWTCQWKHKFWRGDVNPEYEPDWMAGSNNFRKRGVSRGDVAFVISVSDGQLYLGGRMEVKRVDTRRKDVRDWGTGPAYPEWIIGEKETGTPLNFHRRLAPELTRKLRLMASG